MITDYIGGEGSAETPKNDYVIYGWPLIVIIITSPPDFDNWPLCPIAPPCSSLLPHVHSSIMLLLEAQWSGWSSKDQSSLPLQDQNHYSLMVIAPMSFAVPTCHWACSTPNRAEGSPRRSNNSDGKVRFTFARCNFCFHIFCQVRFLIIFCARYDFHLSQAVTASLPQFVLQFSAYMLVDT